MKKSFLYLSRFAALAGLFCLTTTLSYADNEGVSISVHQTSELKHEKTNHPVIGDWVLNKPDNTRLQAGGELETFSSLYPGLYNLFAGPPENSRVLVSLNINGDTVQEVNIPQITFNAAAGDVVTISIHYIFPLTGDVIVNSDPLGIEFTLNGPYNLHFDGKTQSFFEDLPIGQYTVDYHQLEGCRLPPTQSQLLTEDGRAEFSLTLKCDLADALRAELNKDLNEDHVTIQIDNRPVSFKDVPNSAWFAPFVSIAARYKIIEGTKDRSGNLTGYFKPEEKVTVAQLSKIAHELAKIDETEITTPPLNLKAQNQWYSGYFASAEKRGWLIYIDPAVSPGRYVTRGEVVVTLLQAFNIPRQWPKATLFKDVNFRTPYASAIETAVNEGLIEGYKDQTGNDLYLFGPEDKINRAEISKIVAKAIEIYIDKKEEETE